MDNQIITERVNTTITGKINGCNTVIIYETNEDPIPRNISANCTILSEVDPMANTTLNINVSVMGPLDWTIAAVPKEGSLPVILAAIESTLAGYMVNPV